MYCRLGGGVGSYLDRGPGMRPKKAYISKTTEPNLQMKLFLNQHELGPQPKAKKCSKSK